MKTPLLALFLMLSTLYISAQTCIGSLGDPIINYTFGAGANPGASLSTGTTNMQYTSNPCPVDGEYTITNYTTGCFNGWITATDHTGDVNGYFMLINATIQPSTFFVDTIYNLCEGVNYQFAAWVVNMVIFTSGYIEPNLTFDIKTLSGISLQSNTTGNIPSTGAAQWQQFGFNFTTPPAVSTVVLSISNNAPGGSGNDLALDDITFRTVGPDVAVHIQGYPTDTVAFCGTTQALTFTSQVGQCYAHTAYQWQQSLDNGATWTDITGATNPSYNPSINSPGTYLYRLTISSTTDIGNIQCRVVSSNIAVYFSLGPSVSITPKDTTVCPGSTVLYTADGGVTYQWSDQNQGAQDMVTINYNTSYIVEVTNGSGCKTLDTAYASVYTVIPPVITEIGVQQCAGYPIYLSATGGSGYVWSNGDTTANITVYPVSEISYSVTASGGGQNCLASASFSPQYKAPWQISTELFDPPCPGKNIGMISLDVTGNGGTYLYIWNTGDTSGRISSLAPGGYTVSISDSYGCDTSLSFNLQYDYTLSVKILPSDTNVPRGTYVSLQSLTNRNNGNNYTWIPDSDLSCQSCSYPVAHVVDSIYTYVVLVSDQYGCEASDSMHIHTFTLGPVYIPNAFTPNGDGNDDFFQIFSSGTSLDFISVFEVKIFDRWGELVYESHNPTFKWDGTYKGSPMSPGVYVYLIDYVIMANDNTSHKKGSLTLIR